MRRDTTCEPIAQCGGHPGIGPNLTDLDELFHGLGYADTASRRACRSTVRERAPAIVFGVVECLMSRDVRVRQEAAGLLRDLPGAEQAVGALARAASDEDWLVRLWAIDALGRLRIGAREVSLALEQALQDPMPLVRNAAFIALWKVRAPS